MLVDPRTESDWGEEPIIGMFRSVASVLFDEAWAPILDLLRQPRRHRPFALHYRASPKIKLLPINILASCFLQELPRNSLRFFVSPIMGLLLNVEGKVTSSQTFCH